MKSRFAFTTILTLWLLQSFVHGTTAVLSWHIKKILVIFLPVIELQLCKFSIEFELQTNNCLWNGSIVPALATVYIYQYYTWPNWSPLLNSRDPGYVAIFNSSFPPLQRLLTLMSKPFLPEASFGLRVLSLPASVCVSVRPSVCAVITCLSAW